MLLSEYAITPDVFDSTSYASEDLCAARLDTIREVLLNESLVRDLRAGAWSALLRENHRPWHRRARELLKKLATQNRLVPYSAQLAADPATDNDWCDEALASHNADPVSGIIASAGVAQGFVGNPVVASIERLGSAAWWTTRSPSIRLARQLADYQSALSLVLRHANSIMFIDPHLDPSQRRYREFVTLVTGAGNRQTPPLIEIHRVCYRGSGKNREILNYDTLEASFHAAFDELLNQAGLSADVFIWDDFHDRYVISDLVGISLPNGFDTTTAENARTTWTRMGRNDRDDVQREFDPASSAHKLRHRFSIGL